MIASEIIDNDWAFAAFERRDRGLDGQFVGAVKTTGIYCKPSCPARRPRRENVEFFLSGNEARGAGYRACLRCTPDDIGRDREAVMCALKMIEEAEEALPLEEIARAVGYAPHHFHRLFKRDIGVTPAQYTRGLRMKRAEAALGRNVRISDAIYDAGYSGPSRFYAATKGHLGMTPSTWKKGGAGITIHWTEVDTYLGKMLLAATDKGICRLSFGEDDKEIRRRFPKAQIEEGGESLQQLVALVVAAVDNPRIASDLPLDVQGTAFQQAVWQELRRIPAGETRSYAQIAAAVGKPKAVRAAGTANGQNPVAVLIPCHRVICSDGALGGYAYGLSLKQTLLERESTK